MSAQDGDGEADSLFGSPPPSPSLGFIRGGSPELALPGCQAATCAILPELPKNVGTIALPGSHDRSELSDSPPAHSPRPQTLDPVPPIETRQQRQYQFQLWEGPGPTSVRTASSRRAKTPKKAKKAGSVTSGAQSDIQSALPYLPYFLRLQPELLGLSGVAGGARPMQSYYGDNRGTSKDNPIIVEDELTPQDASQSHPQPSTSSPNSQAIADTLVSQGGIFPVLRSLVPYLGLSTHAECRSRYTPYQFRAYAQKRPSSSGITAPPLKRRKLNSVPAGAKDWDVPYPFPENEGPKNYLESWKKKRGKKLMMKLVSLVRDAVQKATAKTQMQGSTLSSPASIPPAPVSVQQQAPLPAMDDDALLAELQSLAGPSPTTSNERETAFPDIFSSPVGETTPSWDLPSDFDSLLGAVNNALSDPDVQLAGEDWAMMSSYPFSPTSSGSPTLSSSTRLPTPSDATSLSLDSKDTDAEQFMGFSFDDIPLDPGLFDFSSCPGDLPSTVQDSVGSKDEGDGVVACLDETATPRQQNGFTFDQECVPASESTSNSVPPAVVAQSNAVSDELQFIVEEPIPAQSDDVRPPPPPSVPPTSPPPDPEVPQRPLQIRFKEPLVETKLVHNKRSGSAGPVPSTKKLDRKEVLRRARIRREQLAAELARAKIELWETTIESGVLTHLSKDKELHSRS